MRTLNLLDIRQNFLDENIAEATILRTAFPHANVGFPAFHRPAASTINIS
jgi:hypothetical protein